MTEEELGFDDNQDEDERLESPETPEEEPLEPEQSEEEDTEEDEVSEPDEDAEEPEQPKEELQKPPKKRKDAKARINELIRKTHQAENEAAELRARMQELQNSLALSHMAANKHYEDSVELQLEKAKQLKKNAYEAGDVEAMTEADIALSRAAYNVNQSQAWKAQQQIQQAYEPERQDPEQARMSNLQEWASRNPWAVPGHPNYNPKLSSHLQEKLDLYEQDLKSKGLDHLIGEVPYFQEIDRYIATIEDEFDEDDAPAPPKMQTGSLRMKQKSPLPAQPLRAKPNYGNKLPLKQNFKLTREHQRMADIAGIPHEEYIKHVLAEERAQELRRRNLDDYNLG